jgi:undecaprenyl diphosphate synthase
MTATGRWAKARGLPRMRATGRGAEACRARCFRAAGEAGVECLTLYAFSCGELRRPQDEINDLWGFSRFLHHP